MSTLSAHYDTPVSTTGQGLRIGVFDSGVGGLSVLRAIREVMPQADLVYVADSANAPYGERSDAFIQSRCQAISGFLREQQVDGIVVACNTATAIAVEGLRNELPFIPIIGVEPGIKPGILRSTNKRVGVLATPGTLASAKFKALLATQQGRGTLILQACPGLAKEIESGSLERPELQVLIERFCQPLIEAQVDTVVLGCTHYPFAAQLFHKTLGPHVTLLDTADAVAKRTAELLLQRRAPQKAIHSPPARIDLWTTGSPAHLGQVASNWLGWKLSPKKLNC